MGALPVVKGTRLRATKINSCGLPIAGAANRLVTDGFISVDLDPEMKAREELEQTNAEGKVIVSATTPATRKHHNVSIVLGGVDPDLYSMFASYERILDYDNTPNGIADTDQVDGDYGVALEIWTGGKSDEDCPEPSSDSIFSTAGSGKSHGYLLLGATEWVPGGFKVEAAISNFTLSGITIPMPQWGRGVYNVAGTDSSGTPGRLLKSVGKKRHYTFFRTPVPPPSVTDGACALATTSIFTGGTSYFGASAAAVAPAQPICNGVVYTATITGSPTGGGWTFTLDGQTTSSLTTTTTAGEMQTAIEALSNVAVGEVTVTGSTGGPYTITLDRKFGVPTKTASFTGGTAPNVTLVAA